MAITRRDFLKYAGGGVATLVVGDRLGWLLANPAHAAVGSQTINLRVTDAMKEMVTYNARSAPLPYPDNATCYHWVYEASIPDPDPMMPPMAIPAECPGPNIIATRGDTITVNLMNDLDEDHEFAIPVLGISTGAVLPGESKMLVIETAAMEAGAYLYYDNLNAPVNRVMGLHGAFILMPDVASGTRYTPYTTPTASVQALFDDLGVSTGPWPGLAWEEGDDVAASYAPRFRQYIWVLHQASPNLFKEIGELAAGENYDPDAFVQAFLRDPFSATRQNRIPQYFTINGQSGHFAHNNPFICPNLRVGEPTLIRVLNAGLMTHSMHIHANHQFVISVNGVVQENPIWVDTFTSDPLDVWDWLNPYMKPPDVPNARGIGLADAPLATLMGGQTWPPLEELNCCFPPEGTFSGDVDPLLPPRSGAPIHVYLSPMCFPMHDHSEPSQTAQGGNYNCGLISGMNFTGDRNQPGGVLTFPSSRMTQFGPAGTGPAAGPEDAGM